MFLIVNTNNINTIDLSKSTIKIDYKNGQFAEWNDLPEYQLKTEKNFIIFSIVKKG